MADIPKMEIPDAVRQAAEKNIEQARSAYGQMLDMVRKSQDQISRSSETMTETALDLQAKMLRFTEENLDAGFKLAGELAAGVEPASAARVLVCFVEGLRVVGKSGPTHATSQATADALLDRFIR